MNLTVLLGESEKSKQDTHWPCESYEIWTVYVKIKRDFYIYIYLYGLTI